jgi:hypothetical protein
MRSRGGKSSNHKAISRKQEAAGGEEEGLHGLIFTVIIAFSIC